MAYPTSEPAWLHTIGQIAGTLLVLELLAALFIILVIAVALAVATWYLKHRVMPTVDEYTTKANQIMHTADRSTARVVQGVAEFHGRARSVETFVRVLLFGRKGAAGLSAVPVGSAQRGVRVTRGMSPIEGYAPQDLAADPNLSTRDISAVDFVPRTTTVAPSARAGRQWPSPPDATDQNAQDGHNGHLPPADEDDDVRAAPPM